MLLGTMFVARRVDLSAEAAGEAIACWFSVIFLGFGNQHMHGLQGSHKGWCISRHSFQAFFCVGKPPETRESQLLKKGFDGLKEIGITLIFF